VVTMEWIRPESLSTPAWIYRFAGLRLHAEVPLVALLGLVHLRIPLTSLVFGGAGGGDQGGIDDRALPHGHAQFLEMGFDGLENLLTKVELLQQVSEHQDRGLIWDPVAEHVDARKPPHRRHLDQRILRRWIAQRVPLLHQVDPQHGGQRIRRAAAFAAGLGIVRLDQFNQGSPWHHLVHLSQELLTLGALLGCGLLVITKSQLLTAHHPSSGL
jgi:hypothetical protein